MDKQDKIAFVRQLALNVVEDICSAIELGRMPEEWDGFELRQYMADRFAEANFVKMNRGRKYRYNNEIIARDL